MAKSLPDHDSCSLWTPYPMCPWPGCKPFSVPLPSAARLMTTLPIQDWREQRVHQATTQE